MEDDDKDMEAENYIYELYERVVIRIVVYGSETWSLSAQERRKIEVFEMRRF